MHEEDKEVRGLSAVARYTITAVILGLVTAVEVLVLYPPLAEAGDTFKIGLLSVLSVGKFIVVVALFMHLWNDSPLFTGIFGLGMVIGAGTLVALVALHDIYPPPENAVKPPPMHELYETKRKMREGGGEHGGGHHGSLQFEQMSPELVVVRAA